MKKLVLFAMGAMVSMASYAQEDVTHYIQNAGFDEDLTFQADGAMKTIVSTETSLSERSWAYIAADNTVYAKPKESSSQQRKDGRSKLDAVNGFVGQVSGWTITTGSTLPACEWTYFGTIPYALAQDAVPIADDGDTYLLVPEKPEVANGDDNVGFVYMRAGWGGRATYKQTVKLPCAKYRLEYWSININPNGTNGKNLSKVTCRKDSWPDETGFSATEWTLHEIVFTPTAEFTMEFGFESSGGSGSNPFLCIDGIKLYKIDDADVNELVMAAENDCEELAGEALSLGYGRLADYISDYGMNIAGDTDEESLANLTASDEMLAKFREAIAEAEKVDAILAKIDNLLQTTGYPGKEALEAAYQKILNYKEGHPEDDEDVAAEILGAVEEGNNAIKAYYMSQMDSASEANPADFTIMVNHSWFIKDEFAPTLEDETWVFPNAENYTDGSSNDDFSSEGWTKTGAYQDGDQRLNYKFGYPCWNAWGSGFTSTIGVGQTIEGLPDGYYTVSAQLVTQSGCLTDQHVYAQSSAEKKISAPLTQELWDEGLWETVAMTPEQKVLVVDGKLTIGAEGTGSGSGAAGWFCATNFQLYFLGLATEAEINAAVATAMNAKVAEANEFAGKMHFAVDKNALLEVITQYAGAADKASMLEAIEKINEALTEAQKSETKYLDYLPEDEAIVEGKTLREVAVKLADNSYGSAAPIVQFALNYVNTWIACDTATYTKFDAAVDRLKNYVNTYVPVFMEADELQAKVSGEPQTLLQNLMNTQKEALTSEMKTKEEVQAYTDELNAAMFDVNKQKIYEELKDGSDFTAFIQNPNAEALAGWTFEMGNGDGNGEKSGQWFLDTTTRYFDTYNSGGLVGFKASQVVTGLPNGTYQVDLYARTPAEGAYVFAGVADSTFVEIPLDYYITQDEETGEDVQAVASDKCGPIWEDAKALIESADYNSLPLEEQERIEAIYNANNGEGRGWKAVKIENIVVTNHEMFIGTMTGRESSGAVKPFTGAWYSVGGWKLTRIEKGDDGDWTGPFNGIESLSVADQTASGIFTITGVKTNQLQRGLNIIVRNGKAMKVLVK